MIIRKLILFFLVAMCSLAVFAAPWSVSKPLVTDQVIPEFALNQYKTLLVSAPDIEPEYRKEIEKRTAENLIKISDFGVRAVSYSEIFPMNSNKKLKDINKIIKSKNVDGILVIRLKEGKKRDASDHKNKIINDDVMKKKLSIAEIGFKKNMRYDFFPIDKRDRKKRTIHAKTFLYDAKSNKSAWYADIKIKVIRSRSTGIHVAGYLAKHISKTLEARNMLARGAPPKEARK